MFPCHIPSRSSRPHSRTKSTWCRPRSPPSETSRERGHRPMASDVTMPRLSDSMEEGTVLKWLVEEGGEVKRGEPLVEIETDKANMTYDADSDGTLVEVVAQEGDTLAIGEVIARIGDPSEAAGNGKPSGGKEAPAEEEAGEAGGGEEAAGEAEEEAGEEEGDGDREKAAVSAEAGGEEDERAG